MRTSIEPYRIKVVEPISFTTRERREWVLAEAGYNLFRVPAREVTIDLLTDSGVCAMSARQWSALMQGDEACAGTESFYHFEDVVRRITGLPHVLPVHAGRAAERLLFEALVHQGDLVPGNMYGDTTRANLERLGAVALDLPVREALTPSVERPFKGNVDLERLEHLFKTEPAGRLRVVILTLTSNGCGGQPVSLANVRATRKLCDLYGALLLLDAARYAENAWLVHQRERGLQVIHPAEIARAIFDLCDGCLMSAKKDGLVNTGGFVAVRDPELHERLRRAMVVSEGSPTYGGLAGRDLEAMAVGLEEGLDPAYLEERTAQARAFGERLLAAHVPIVRPVGGHAVYVDSRAFAAHVDPREFPGHALVCELYLHAGVRACELGQLMRGVPDADGRETPVALDLVRLALPRRVYTSRQLQYAAEAVIEIHQDARRRLRPMEIVGQPGALRHFNASLRPLPAHVLSAAG